MAYTQRKKPVPPIRVSEDKTPEMIDAEQQFLSSFRRNLEIIKTESDLFDAEFALTTDRIKALAAQGLPSHAICNLYHKRNDTIDKNPEFRQAFEFGRAQIGGQVRAAIVDQALNNESLTAMIHLDKIFNNDQQAQQIDLSVKQDPLKDVSTDTLIEIMYEQNNKPGDEDAI